MTINYSDGAEATVQTILREATDLSSTSLIGLPHYGDLALRYHLCPERANLLRHLDLSGLDVLELGAGMGATSRYIAEHCRKFVAVEGAPDRAAALELRLRDLSNWAVHTMNAQDFESDERFDVVCMIGVLEYAGVYINLTTGENPYAWLLQHATKFLKPGGVLILAIENRNGIKYWAGAPEDHTSRMFDGICGYTHSPAPRTFSRKVLLDLVRTAGLSSIEEYYPWPDYKMPYAVIHKSLVDSHPLFAAEVAGDATTREVVKSNRFFPESIALIEAARSGLFADMSNSFLLVAGATESSAIQEHLLRKTRSKGETAWHYTVSRKVPSYTSFFSSASDGVPRSQKRPLCNHRVNHPFESYSQIRWRYGVQNDVKLETSVLQKLRVTAYAGKVKEFQSEMERFIQWAFEKYQCDDQRLAPEAFDLTPSNTVERDGEFDIFDQEWETLEPFSKSWFILRNLLAVDDALLMIVDSPWKRTATLYETLCNKFGVEPNLIGDIQLEADMQAEVHRHVDRKAFVAALERHVRTHRPPTVFPRNAMAVQQINQVLLRDRLTFSGFRQLIKLAPSFQSITNRRWVRATFKIARILKNPSTFKTPRNTSFC